MTSVPATTPARPLTQTELDALGVTCSLTTAARALSISRAYAYRLAAQNSFPIRVIHIGNRLAVNTNDLRNYIGA